ncbi:MAG: mechanosensitive ion channel family protein [Arcobacteraceae bacterium]|nr:mechanosensitive ion channel family protein [Arcobacteraceae bacterium]MCD4771353.1 mechanosensitive ion channel family protein [archaeon]
MIEIFDPNTDKYIYAILIFSFFQFFRVFFRKISYKIVQKTSTKFDDEILESIEKPVDYLFIIIGINIALSILTFDNEIEDMINKLLRSGFILVIFWGALNVLTNLSVNIHKITDKLGDKFSAEVLNFIIKSIRFFIFIIGFIVVLQEWGYNVSGFLASMGLIGMALALAAKDTAANLFGSLVIFIDKPFKVGDWIKTPQVEGTIETIGIRSTKVRTFAQALVTVPNATLANSAILNWSAMGKRRIKMNIGITYDTPGQTVENIIKDIKVMLENNEDIHQDTIHIYFSEFAASSLNIFCYYFTKTTNWGEFMRVRENTYLEIMKIVERNGTSFAFPTQTLHIEKNKELVE